jgi:uncharacterized membrane protein YozB (DUF420 family)
MTADTLYPIFRILHSVLRWVVILTALFAIIRATTGLSFRRGYMQTDDRAGLWFTISMDLQLLIGLILYFFLSPTTRIAMQDFGTAMGNSAMRFFAVEHLALMVVALIVAHVGRSLIRKAPAAQQKHRRALIWYGLAVVLVLAAIPWPFFSYGRPLLPF